MERTRVQVEERGKEWLPGEDNSGFTQCEAKKYIKRLTFAEKILLNEMLKALEQKRQPCPSRPESTYINGQ